MIQRNDSQQRYDVVQSIYVLLRVGPVPGLGLGLVPELGLEPEPGLVPELGLELVLGPVLELVLELVLEQGLVWHRRQR